MLPIYKQENKKILPRFGGRKIKNKENCGLDLYAKNQENQWYIETRCSKHMT
jgi:hypothetical protein